MTKVQEDLTSWIDANDIFISENEDWFQDLSFEEGVVKFKADLTFEDEFVPVTIQIPKTFPKGPYNFTVDKKSHTAKVDSLEDAIQAAINACEKKREDVLDGLVTPTPQGTTTNGPDGEDPWMEETLKELRKKIAHDVSKIHKVDGLHAQAGPVSSSQCSIYLFVNPAKRLNISELIADAWGIDLSKHITVNLTFSVDYTESTLKPTIDCYQSGSSEKYSQDLSIDLANKSKFGLDWTVKNRITEDFFGKYWPLKDNYDEKKFEGRNYLFTILDLAEKAVKHCPDRCLICGEDLSYAGIKPVVCEKATCIFSYEQYGLGVDIENEIIKHPDIVDLMITLAHAGCTAAKNDFNPFEPYPVGIQVQAVDPTTDELVTHNLKRKDDMDNSKVKNLIEKLPPVKELQVWVEKGCLKEELFKIDPCAFSLIRWLVASNRCHLKKLEKNEQIKEMNTKHQYLMLSGTPDTEKRFQELKSKKGTYLGFHGSSACNWHAIMRFGLKNMSGKKGQLHGKAYGDGVYLADAAQTSFGYLKYGTTWSNSSFAENSTTMGIMALCEIIKDPSVKTTPYYVVKDDSLIATRYFFIYEGSGSSSAVGKTLKLPKIQWEKNEE